MSGPKVVRVVTREELVAAGEAMLKRLDAAVAQWEKDCTAIGVSVPEQTVFIDRRNALELVLRADKFLEFARAAAAEIDFLEVDAARRRERAVQVRAQERARAEGGRELASMLLKRLSASAPERAELERAACGQLGLNELDTALARARQALFQSDVQPQLGTAQQALAARLAGAEKAQDFEAWKQNLAKASPRLEAMFAHVVELELLGHAAGASELHRQVLAASAEPEGATREMRLDSLLFALRAAKAEALAHAKLERRAALLAAELQGLPGADGAAEALRAVAKGTLAERQAALELAEEKLEDLKSTQAAEARRQAVLDGLRSLGYQVNEELSTATTSGGRLVMQCPSSATYGVEIAAGAAMERLQVRSVALSQARDQSGDIAEEQRWCNDFTSLKGALEERGCEVVIEKALGVGAVPLKLLATTGVVEVRRSARAPALTRIGKS